MSGDMLSNLLNKGQEKHNTIDRRTNIYPKIMDATCTYNKDCPTMIDCSGRSLCPYCKYYKTDFNIPKMIKDSYKKRE